MTFFSYEPLFAELFRRSVDPDTGEIINPNFQEELNALELEQSKKIEQAALAYRNAMIELEAAKKVKKNLEDVIAKKTASSEFFKDYVTDQLAGKKFKNELISIWYGHRSYVDVPDESLVPDEYFKVERTLKKTEILDAINLGKEVPGASVKSRDYTVIKTVG